jgi:hypothetical protein
MSVTQSVAQMLRERVTLDVESIDRLYLNVYVPKLQRVGGVVGFFRAVRGAIFASSALMEPLTTAFVKAMDRDFGPFFLTFCSYFPYNATLCLNGHEFSSGNWSRRASPLRHWTMVSSPAPIPRGCKRSATS